MGAAFVVAVSCWYLYKKREHKLAISSIKIGATVGLVATLLAAMTGDNSAYKVAQVQPMKLAAMEALYNGGESEGLTIIAAVNPFKQADFEKEKEPAMRIAFPNALSFLATRSMNGYVPGVNDILNGYTKSDGTKEPSVDEKIARGKKAIQALKTFREYNIPESISILQENMKYFGYGYIKDKKDLVPSIPICFYAFRVMVGLGCLFILSSVLLILRIQERHPALHLVPLGSISHDTFGIHSLRIGMDCGRDRTPAMDDTRLITCECSRLRHRGRQCSHHLLHLPCPLYYHACRGNQHHGKANQERSRIREG